MGDFNGIGPEVTLNALQFPEVKKICQPVLIGSMDVFEWNAQRLERIRKNFVRGLIHIVDIRKFHKPKIEFGKVSKEAGAYAGEAIEKAAELCLEGSLDAMVTSPVSKDAMSLAGYRYSGQTEMLSELTKSNRVAMMLVAGDLRVGLATVHVPLSNVHKKISKQTIAEKLSVIHLSLRRDFGIKSPNIAVLALNPHAGENGMIGEEEKKYIVPVLRSMQKKKIYADGPFPADGFFGTHAYTKYDAVLAMYHDQGLIPLKMLGFDIGVNFSAGLPIVRTSPDHGTAFDIAGKGIANPRSMIEAIKLAVTIVKNRKRNSR